MIARVTCSCVLHRCSVCSAVDVAQDASQASQASGPVDLWIAYSLADAWGASTPGYLVTPVGSGSDPARDPARDPWSHIATVDVDGSVTWHGGWECYR